MFCGHCGTKNPDINKFCRECGAKLPGRASRTLSEDQFADLRAPLPSPPVDHGKVAVLMDVAFSYHREGKIDQAIETCLQATGLNDQSTSAHSLLALLYEEKGQFDLAVAHLQRVLDFNPESVADQENLARLLGDAPPHIMGAGAAKPPPRLAFTVNRPLAASIGAGAFVLVAVLTISIPRLGGPSKDDGSEIAGRPFPPPPPPAQSISAAVRERRMADPGIGPPSSALAPQTDALPAPQSAAQPRPGENPVVQPPRSEMPTPPAPRRPPTLPGEDEIEPLPPPPAPRRVVSPPVIYLPPTQRPRPETPSASDANPPAVRDAVRAQGPVEVAVTIEQGGTPPTRPMRAEPSNPPPTGGGSRGGSDAPAPGPRLSVRTHETTPGDYQEWALSAAAQGDYDKALSNFRKALDGTRSSRERGKIHQHMAYAYQQLGRNSDAGAEYRRAISAYEEQLREGNNADLARSSIRSCQDGLRTLGM